MLLQVPLREKLMGEDQESAPLLSVHFHEWDCYCCLSHQPHPIISVTRHGLDHSWDTTPGSPFSRCHILVSWTNCSGSHLWFWLFPLFLNVWLNLGRSPSLSHNGLLRISLGSSRKLPSMTQISLYLMSLHHQYFSVPCVKWPDSPLYQSLLAAALILSVVSLLPCERHTFSKLLSYCPKSILLSEFLNKVTTTTSLEDKICTYFQINSFLKFMRLLRYYI